MKKVITAFVVVAFSAMTAHADLIAQWTFEVSPPADLLDSTTISGIAADVGAGTASGAHASAATDWTTPTGNGSANALSANTWAIGDYYQFSVSTLGYQSILVGWAQTSSTTGPGEFSLSYQVNGGGFTVFADYVVLPNSATPPGLGTWSTSTENPGYNYSYDLSAITALDNATTVDFRLVMRTTNDATPPGTVATTGTSRVDNFNVQATLIPEPGTLGLLGVGLLGLAARRRR